jgi:hypothetical protein
MGAAPPAANSPAKFLLEAIFTALSEIRAEGQRLSTVLRAVELGEAALRS